MFVDKQCPIIEILSNGTLLIVAYHKFLLDQLHLFDNSVLLRCIVSIVVVLVFYYQIVIIKKYIPFLIGLKK